MSTAGLDTLADRLDCAADGLLALLDAIVPADEAPSASQAGVASFLSAVLADRPDWRPRISELVGRAIAAADLGELDDDPDWPWFTQLVMGGYYADRRDGGDERSWSSLGWRPEPAGGWPIPVPVAENPPAAARPEVGPADLAERYDVVVIGSGAGGGTAACGLAEAGRSVLVVEAGDWPDTDVLAAGQLRNPRAEWGLPMPTRLSDPADRRLIEVDGRRRVVSPIEAGWGANAVTAGGGTRVYGAQAWRFSPTDFAMASSYGVPDGSALADWPIGYAELEPYYDRAEREVGVSGDLPGEHGGPRSRPYPMAPLPPGPTTKLFATSARRLGFGTIAVPLLINSTPYLGRAGCARCRMCVGFACPVDAKNGSQNTMLTRAFATGRCSIALRTRATRILTDASGRAVGVALAGRDESAGRDGASASSWRREILAEEIVVAAGAIETARLLLNSAHDHEPDGLGNDHDQVGRHLQAHLYGGAFGVFADQVDDLLGPGPSIATTDFRHGNTDADGAIIGGGILANEFTLTPANLYRNAVGAGLLPRWGRESKAGMRRLHRRLLRVMGPVQEVTSAESRVRVDPSARDAFGAPVAVLSGGVHPEDVRGRNFLADRAADWLREAGAEQVLRMAGRPGPGPSAGQHQAGTCRMGADPASSVVDPLGRVWRHPNVRVMDGSVHVTNGGVNPVLTIFANAMRMTEAMTGANSPTVA